VPAVAVRVTLPPAQKVAGPLAEMAGVNVPTVTVALPLFVQPLASVTLTLSVTGEPNGVKFTASVPSPLLIVAFVAVHENVAPALAGTLALALVFAHIDAGAVMAALGSGSTVTATGALVAVQPLPSVVVTL
jgi:hypothetical protein